MSVRVYFPSVYSSIETQYKRICFCSAIHFVSLFYPQIVFLLLPLLSPGGGTVHDELRLSQGYEAGEDGCEQMPVFSLPGERDGGGGRQGVTMSM